MEGIELKTVTVNGVDFRVATAGTDGAPVVLFIHGFPELWYSWQHQISSVAAAGYRAVAPDLRGYGGSYSPPDPSSYTCFHIVGDLIAIISAVVGEDEKVFVVGHDWGAIMAWYLCLLRPDRVRALVNLSVPFVPINPKIKPIERLKAAYGDDLYICRFQYTDFSNINGSKGSSSGAASRFFVGIRQIFLSLSKFAEALQPSANLPKEPGEIEAEFADVGTERVVKKFLTYQKPDPIFLGKDKAFWGPPDSPITLPSWLSEEDVQYYVSNFEKTGFTGPVNFYRNMNLNNELLAPWASCRIQVPTKFVVGDQDLSYHMAGTKDYIHGGGFKKAVPLLEEPVVLEGVGHFIMVEKPEEISQIICDFFNKF